MDVVVIHEVWTETVGAQFGMQWCRYSFSQLPVYGYRFVCRDEGGRLLPESSQALIPRAAWIFELIQKATDAGWFVSAELGAGAHKLTRAG
jgi:hypothetical protein